MSALEVCSRQGAIQIHVYLYLYLTPNAATSLPCYGRIFSISRCWRVVPSRLLFPPQLTSIAHHATGVFSTAIDTATFSPHAHDCYTRMNDTEYRLYSRDEREYLFQSHYLAARRRPSRRRASRSSWAICSNIKFNASAQTAISQLPFKILISPLDSATPILYRGAIILRSDNVSRCDLTDLWPLDLERL